MTLPDPNRPVPALQSFRASLTMLALGLAILAFLVAIDRKHWFELRPASGTATALWHASDATAPAPR